LSSKLEVNDVWIPAKAGMDSRNPVKENMDRYNETTRIGEGRIHLILTTPSL